MADPAVWHDPDPKKLKPIAFQCYFCNNKVSSTAGYYATVAGGNSIIMEMRLCPHCSRPTLFYSGFNSQVPSPAAGHAVEHLPPDVNGLYNEARTCFRVNAYTPAVLAFRKLLMHVAVDKGAKDGLKFIEYLDYLDKNNYLGAGGRDWVDPLRKKGNEATHQIVKMSEQDARELLDFAEMLLKLVYEFPAKAPEDQE